MKGTHYFEPYHKQKRGRPRREVVFESIWRPLEKVQRPISWLSSKDVSHYRGPSSPCQEDISSLTLHGQWASINGTLRWVSPDHHCVPPILTEEDVSTCIDQLDSLTILGDSHLRHFSKWLLGYKGVERSKLHYIWGDAAGIVPGIQFLWNSYTFQLANRTDHDLYPSGEEGRSGTSLTNKDVVIMNTCHWDLRRWDIGHIFANHTLPAVVSSLERLR